MRAVVLVGGFGTRLRPLTFTRPKQMLPIVNRPMIERVVGRLVEFGVDDVVLSLGYRPDAFAAAYPEGRCAGAALHYAVEPEPLDTAGAIRFAALDAGIRERFLVLNGDVLTDLDVSGFLAFHEESNAEATIHLHPVEDPSRYGVVPTDREGRVLEFVEKPPRESAPTNLINAGTYVLEPSVIDRIPDGRKVSVERETFPALVADGTLYATEGSNYWIDTGTPQEYLRSQTDLLDGTAGPSLEGSAPGVIVHPEAAVKQSALDVDVCVEAQVTVERSALGAGAVVESGATVARSVLLPGARVAAGAVVEDSVVGAGAVVGARASVLGFTVVGDGETVEGGSRLEGARVPVPTT